uniref:Uncharacterized protein n=1 Tax=Rhizophora mucronata TaxID=61149 RepID=A0A2P2PTV4_RHIMU
MAEPAFLHDVREKGDWKNKTKQKRCQSEFVHRVFCMEEE